MQLGFGLGDLCYLRHNDNCESDVECDTRTGGCRESENTSTYPTEIRQNPTRYVMCGEVYKSCSEEKACYEKPSIMANKIR